MTEIPPEAKAAADRGDLIDAIKRTREATGLGLKNAKEAVENYLAAHPNTNGQFRAARRDGTGPVRVMAIAGLILIAAAVYWWLSRG